MISILELVSILSILSGRVGCRKAYLIENDQEDDMVLLDYETVCFVLLHLRWKVISESGD